MIYLEQNQRIGQLEKRKGGYFYLKIESELVETFDKGRRTRLIYQIDDCEPVRCGLNHLGDGNFYVIVASKLLNDVGKKLDSEVRFKLWKDPDQLGVAIPESIEAFLEQDDHCKSIYEKLTDGKKRTLIYTVTSTKNIDKQIERIQKFIAENS
ncbi:YdeI/OmpD-associated family protein [Jiulongibacter sp. NS-SX5]|uniref:YdeI/OmpD-associated family protein n=1 Tax=Jiulongibacter sp. NS-SX5 TaxID=3463854 RepID=UPI0040583727